MRDLVIPIQNFDENDKVDIEVRVEDNKFICHYKLESFSWEVKDELNKNEDEVTQSLARIHRLRKAIKEYDQEWEVIEILTPSKDASTIQVLYRKKM